MKVNFSKEQIEICICKLIVGDTFTLRRSSTDEIGVYMVTDKKSGAFLDNYQNKIMAVNLATGQVRAFNGNIKVKPVVAEVNLLD